MRIAVSGKSGCGNTTVERNMDFWDFCALATRDDNIDKELDRRQVEMAMAQENCVLGSRLAIWMLKDADFKVYLLASDLERARRITNREGGTLEERLRQTQEIGRAHV